MADTWDMSTTRVIIAVRVSSEDQREKGYGHAAQLERLPQQDDDLDLASRPVMAALIQELPDTQPTFLVCRKLDRLHRSNLQWQYLQHRLKLAGVEGIAQFPSLASGPEARRIGSPRDRAFAAMEAAWASLAVVSRFFVAPHSRRRGIGQELMGCAEQEAGERGLHPVLDVADHNRAAIRFYEHRGWRLVGEADLPPGDEGHPLQLRLFVGGGAR